MTEVETITKKEKALRNDGIDRRDFPNCMAWAGTGLLWTFGGGVPTSRLFAIRTVRRRRLGELYCGSKGTDEPLTMKSLYRMTRSSRCAQKKTSGN
jgi:hypothetical protein